MSGKKTPLQQTEQMLVPHFPKRHVTSFLKHFLKSVDELRSGEWENCIAKSGKFVEAVLKALFMHVGKSLPTGRGFKADLIINGLAQIPDDGTYHDSIRLTIPRACRFIYDLASNRGGRHDPDEVDPNEVDAYAVAMSCSWILAEMIRLAQKGAVDLSEAKALVESLAEKRYPLVEDVEGRLYFHLRNKSAVDVALLALAHRYPKRLSRQELVDTVRRNGFKKRNAEVAVQRIAKFADDDGHGELRLLATGLKKAEDLMQGPSG
ncbi:MAG: hypothetical protein L0Z53_23485 [Acidobacteriales bacterium]|nr:hypothetical protein [Terriglobales bacterium]